MRSVLVVLGVLALVGCGGDSTGPSGSASLAGTWELTFPTLTANGVSCTMVGLTMTLTMSGSNKFSGTHTSGNFNCPGGGAPFAGGTIINGTLNGPAVAFDFDNTQTQLSGSYDSGTRTMSGQVVVDFSDGTHATGTWAADLLPGN